MPEEDGKEGVPRRGGEQNVKQTKQNPPLWIPVTNGLSLPIKPGPGPKATQCTESAGARSVVKLIIKFAKQNNAIPVSMEVLVYGNSRNGATPSFFHKCAKPFP